MRHPLHKKEEKISREIGNPYLDISEQEWVAYFSSAKDPEKTDLSKLKTAMGKLRMDTTIVNCPSRVMKLVRDFDAVLVKLSMDGFDTDEPKLPQEWLINAIQPEALRDIVK